MTDPGLDMSEGTPADSEELSERLRELRQRRSFRAWAFYLGGAVSILMLAVAVVWACWIGLPLAAGPAHVSAFIAPLIAFSSAGAVLGIALFKAAFQPVGKSGEGAVPFWQDLAKELVEIVRTFVKSKSGS